MKEEHFLLIESSTHNCSVSISSNGEIHSFKEEVGEQFIHAEKLHLFVDELIHDLGPSKTIKAVAVSNGPGSYTGLRIGLSLAKGLCYGWDCPLILHSTLEVLYHSFRLEHPTIKAEHFWPMLDARRMEVYTNLFSKDGEALGNDRPMILTEDLPNEIGVCFGNGSEKARELLESAGHIVIDGPLPTSRAMAQITKTAFDAQDFADKAYSEPFYLKAFQAGKLKPMV
jgi:tRNA threonylcarbamoyladenosine biosynthesis protein TsaB